VLGLSFFVGDVILGSGLGFFGLRHQTLGRNRKREPFVYLKKLGENLHLWSYGMKSPDWLYSVCSLEDVA